MDARVPSTENERSRSRAFDEASGLLEGPPDARVLEQLHIATCMERAAAGEFDSAARSGSRITAATAQEHPLQRRVHVGIDRASCALEWLG